MENRFGVKDFFLFLLIGALLVVVILAMVQFDRQWDEMTKIRGKVEEIQDRLSRGIAINTGNNGNGGTPSTGATTESAAADPNDPFAGIRAAQGMPGYARGDWLIDT